MFQTAKILQISRLAGITLAVPSTLWICSASAAIGQRCPAGMKLNDTGTGAVRIEFAPENITKSGALKIETAASTPRSAQQAPIKIETAPSPSLNVIQSMGLLVETAAPIAQTQNIRVEIAPNASSAFGRCQ